MALWQFDIDLTPRGAPAPTVTADGYETSPISEPLIAKARHYLAKHFGEGWEMLPGWLVFGCEDGSRFDLCVDEVGSGSVRARIDARSHPGGVLLWVCELAELLRCDLYVPERGGIIQPNRAELERAFGESAAVRFVHNQQAFLSEKF